MSAELTPVLKQRFFDFNGLPLAMGKLFTYVAGTTTPLVTYTDQSGLVQNTNPVVLDADGYADVWMAQTSYKFILKDANDVVQFTVDNVMSIGQQATNDTKFNITNGESATALAGESWDGIATSSVEYHYECQRNDTIMANGRFLFQYINSVWRIVDDSYAGDDTGLTFSFVQTTTVGQLYVAVNSGAGNGTLKFKKFPYAI